MMLCDTPLIGLVLVQPDRSVDIVYYTVSSLSFAPLQTVLDALVTILGYQGVDTVLAGSDHYGPIACPTTPQRGG